MVVTRLDDQLSLLPDLSGEPGDALSPGRRLTLRQRQAVAEGRHPLTGGPARPDLGTCGTCALRVLLERYPKCIAGADLEKRRSGPYMTHGPATDVRRWWPACPSHQAVAE